MAGDFFRIDIVRLASWVLTEWEREQTIFGIPRELFYTPDKPQLLSHHSGMSLGTPLGVAAGPHTQLAQNIVVAWLTGCRFIELKTVQIPGELAISKPCIAMDDEGYNCERSQELKLDDSLDEYINAWILIHLIHWMLGWESHGAIDTIFSVSVGFDREGIKHPTTQRFIAALGDIRLIKDEKIAQLRPLFPKIDEIAIPDVVSHTICLSTMHGCPPEEIEKTALYLIQDKRKHTILKFNPTLLGARELRHILNETLGFPIVVPDEAFVHELAFEDALPMLRRLKEASTEAGVSFSVKLTNTLETQNSRELFSAKEKTVYMSGRALHVLSVSLAARLQEAFAGELDISFAGGGTSDNICRLIACGLAPVTVCSDFLKPGGTMRALQYLEKMAEEVNISRHLNEMTAQERVARVKAYAGEVLLDKAYAYQPDRSRDVKTQRELFKWDCAAAPCAVTCPVDQEISTYMHHVSRGENDLACATVLRSNPLAGSTGMICTQSCQTRCMRSHIDEPLLIREVKRFAIERGNETTGGEKEPAVFPQSKKARIAVIGAGPAGLSAAYFLAEKGCLVNLYEKKSFAGGLIADVIPDFRLHRSVVERDVTRVARMGVNFHMNAPIDQTLFDELRKENDFVVVACGLALGKKLDIPCGNARGVWDHLVMLAKVKAGEPIRLGSRIVVIGGGDAAVDAARTALRIAGSRAKVSLVYRRDRKSMPAHHEEVGFLLSEGATITEMALPVKIKTLFGRVRALRCLKTRIVADESGAGVESIEGSEFDIPCDTVIVAIGQLSALPFSADDLLANSGVVGIETRLRNVFVAGDLFRGPSSIIRASADGRLVARAILRRLGFVEADDSEAACADESTQLPSYYRKLATRIPAVRPWNDTSSVASHSSLFEHAISMLSDEEAGREASRCLSCDRICNVCVTVCPNRANVSYRSPCHTFFVYSVTRSSEKDYLIEVMNEYKLKQAFQVVNIADCCNECGNCTTFCPTSGAPYRQKPRLYLRREGLAAAQAGFYLDDTGIEAKFDGKIEQLRYAGDRVTYETHGAKIEMQSSDLSIIKCQFKRREIHGVTTSRAVEMAILFEGLKHKGFLSKTKE